MATPIRADQITASWWQPALNSTGQIVVDAADITQCITIILKTPVGSDVHRPEFGSKIYDYIDWPQPRAVPFVVRETIDAINLWETRITVLSVEVSPFQGGDAGQLLVQVTWSIPDTDFVSVTEVLLGG